MVAPERCRKSRLCMLMKQEIERDGQDPFWAPFKTRETRNREGLPVGTMGDEWSNSFGRNRPLGGLKEPEEAAFP